MSPPRTRRIVIAALALPSLVASCSIAPNRQASTHADVCAHYRVGPEPKTACLSVTAVPVIGDQGSVDLDFSMSNFCGTAISIWPQQFPWGDYVSIELEAVEVEPPHRGLEHHHPLYHDFHERITVAPGEVIHGSVSPSMFFSSFAEVRARSAICLQWWYDYPSELKMGWTSGTVLIPSG
jgi:hypothetical protein